MSHLLIETRESGGYKNMSETIKWNELKPEERDALIAEKVMGWEPVTPYKVFQRYLWKREDAPGLTQGTPGFSQSMDAAWLVLKQAAQTVDKEDLTFELFGTTWGDLDAFSMLDMLCTWTPETICRASLKAIGIEVL
jgi:hypothetical protein